MLGRVLDGADKPGPRADAAAAMVRCLALRPVGVAGGEVMWAPLDRDELAYTMQRVLSSERASIRLLLTRLEPSRVQEVRGRAARNRCTQLTLLAGQVLLPLLRTVEVEPAKNRREVIAEMTSFLSHDLVAAKYQDCPMCIVHWLEVLLRDSKKMDGNAANAIALIVSALPLADREYIQRVNFDFEEFRAKLAKVRQWLGGERYRPWD